MSTTTTETAACDLCRAPATYAGTQDGMRVYVCTANPAHLTRVKSSPAIAERKP